MVYVDREHVGVYVDQKKWDKIKSHLTWIKEQLNNLNSASDWQVSSEFGISHKELEKRRGFLVYASRTYPMMTPYLKDIHQTLDSWRPYQDNDGWKMTMSEIKAAIDTQDEIDYIYPKNAPQFVFPSLRLEDDIDSLIKLFEG